MASEDVVMEARASSGLSFIGEFTTKNSTILNVWCDLNVIIRIECIFFVVLYACKSVDRGTFSLKLYTKNVHRSTLLHAYKK
jgi:hypothetical protein